MEIAVKTISSYAVSACQLLALFVILTGVVKALWIYVRHSLFTLQSGIAFQRSRLELGYSLSLGLSFLVGGSILRTTIAPSWNDIAQLAATITIRTVLNYFLLQAIDNSTRIVAIAANQDAELPLDLDPVAQIDGQRLA
ncbi:MAG: DUF1622 domain-containing protein [Oscillatoriales cyanobacterium RM2_1_1]|nr:DUF1622 domain-containing protein [Oscillatoriales cyanobacterium SM2_3_0]NJO46885.1 DUF1622 domain-containing protein [Oscillatoriales cyanobacterium RM2_1_1]